MPTSLGGSLADSKTCYRSRSMFSLACAVLVVLAAPDKPSPVVATTYHHTFFHGHPVLKPIRPGETVVTKTIDASGRDANGEIKAAPGNPLTGPFSVEG